MINLILVDDHQLVRDGIRSLLKYDRIVNLVGECVEGEQVLGFLKKTMVDVILMDINMPKTNGIDATKGILAAYPDIKILGLTMHNEYTYISQLLKAGAMGYILKTTDAKELAGAINTVYHGGHFFSEDVSRTMMSMYLEQKGSSNSSNDLVSPEYLTERELEVIRLISEGLTNNKIGDKLFISPRTVDTHRRNLLQKIGVNNAAGLVKYARDHNLV